MLGFSVIVWTSSLDSTLVVKDIIFIREESRLNAGRRLPDAQLNSGDGQNGHKAKFSRKTPKNPATEQNTATPKNDEPIPGDVWERIQWEWRQRIE